MNGSRDGENGLLVDPANPEELARAMIHALENKSLRRQAAGLNQRLIIERGRVHALHGTGAGILQTDHLEQLTG